MNEPWRQLKVGDRVRIVRMPSGVDEPGYRFPAETRRLYERLIERGYPQRIYEIDEWGLPWIDCRFRLADGQWEHHLLAVNDDSWVLVKPRADWCGLFGRVTGQTTLPAEGGEIEHGGRGPAGHRLAD
jgi:hypothetical protein